MTNLYDFYITPEEYERAEANGISKRCLEIRVRDLAWNKSKAITQPVIKKHSVKNWVEIAEQNGISKSTFEKRIYRLKWSYEKAATVPIIDEKVRIKNLSNKHRRFPKEILELAKSNGIPYDTFRYRVNRSKMSYLEAATKPLMSSREIGLMRKEKNQKGLDLIFTHSKVRKSVY